MALVDRVGRPRALDRAGLALRAETSEWQRQYQLSLFALDLVLILASTMFARFARFGADDPTVSGYKYDFLAMVMVVGWVATLAAMRAYEIRFLGSGSEEFKRVGVASVRLAAVIGFIAYTAQVDLARGFVAIALPVGTAAVLLGRYAARRFLHGQRAQGRCLHRVLAIGTAEAIDGLDEQLRRSPHAGFQVVGGCTPGMAVERTEGGVPIVGPLHAVTDVLATTGADTVAVTSGPGITPAVLRRLSWDLEDTGADLVVAPALTDVAGPRINIRPVAGLPLLHVDQPELGGFRQLLKAAFERTVAAIAMVLLLPVFALLCIAVVVESRGAPIFRQTRVGRHGKEFTVYKLRTMRADAESLLDELMARNETESGGQLFKLRVDPRVTRLGSRLRTWSLDELPQLWNVVRGDMALVGPRPPLPSEVARYHSDAHRRLLVRPGITGLWQVSGRSDLSWDDTVRLDLYYVENWSFTMDLMILWKTFFAVLRRHGAY